MKTWSSTILLLVFEEKFHLNFTKNSEVNVPLLCPSEGKINYIFFRVANTCKLITTKGIQVLLKRMDWHVKTSVDATKIAWILKLTLRQAKIKKISMGNRNLVSKQVHLFLCSFHHN